MSIKIKDLKTLMVHELKDLYSAETQIIKALPKLAKAAHHAELKAAFETHHEESKLQLQRLEKIFQAVEYSPGGHHCKGMEGLLLEGNDMIEEDAPEEVKDAGLITSAQRVEHYEIAGYGCARTFARLLGMDDIADILQETLDEEIATDQKLTMLAESMINEAAIDG